MLMSGDSTGRDFRTVPWKPNNNQVTPCRAGDLELLLVKSHQKDGAFLPMPSLHFPIRYFNYAPEENIQRANHEKVPLDVCIPDSESDQ